MDSPSRPTQIMLPLPREGRHPWPWVGLAAGVALTLAAWGVVQKAERARLEALRQTQATEMARELEHRLRGLEQALRGAAGYLGRGSLPTRVEWQAYVANLDLPATYPGIQGLSFVEWIPVAGLPAHIQRVRKEGFPDYTVAPGGPLPQGPEGWSSILYLEPMDERNQRAFGKDMLADPARREAMLRSRDKGLVSLSGPVTLYQELATAIQAGTVLFAPVYREGLPLDSVTRRRQALRGWVSFPLRMGDFVQGVLARDLKTTDLHLFDGAPTSAQLPLYDSDLGRSQAVKGLGATRSFDVAGRTWQAEFHPAAGFYAEAGQRLHGEVLIGGLTLSLLLFTWLVTVHRAELRAQRLAHQRGEELLATEFRFRALFEKAPFGMAIVDSLSGRFLSVNPRLAEILGYPPEELLRVDFQSITHPESLPSDLASVQALVAGTRTEIRKEKRYLHRDGHEVWARLSMVRLPVVQGVAPTHLAIVEDITEARRREAERHEAEASLRRSATELHLAQEIGGFGSWRVGFGEGGEVWTISEGLRRIYGHSPDQVITMQTGLDAMFPEDRDFVREAWEGALRGTGSCEWEHRIVLGEETRWLAVRVQVQRTEAGRPVEAVGIVHDITARKRVEEALRASESRWDSALVVAGAGVWDWRADEADLYLSPRYRAMLGYGAAEAFDTSFECWIERIHPEDRAKVMAHVNDYLDGTIASYGPEYRIQHRDGSYLWVKALGKAVTRDREGRPTRVIGTHTDITARKEGEAALSLSQARYHALFELSPDGISVTRMRDGTLFEVNDAWTSMLGFSRAEALGRSTADLGLYARPEDRQAMVDHLAEQGGASRFTVHLLRKDRTPLVAEVNGRVMDLGGEACLVVVLRDETARLATQEALQESEIRARKAESLVLMAGGIAHDFNNLFQSVQSNLEVAAMQARGDAELKQSLAKAMVTLRRAVGLSWKMLDFSGRGYVSQERLDLGVWLPDLLAGLRAGLPPAFHLDLAAESVPCILGDPAKLEQVLRALIDNALEASDPQGGQVRLRLQVAFGTDQPGPGLWPAPRPAGPATVCLEIADDGAGVPPDQLGRICDPFFTTRQAGRGLGLAATLGILTAHRAGLHIFNGEGGGLALRLHFPPGGA